MRYIPIAGLTTLLLVAAILTSFMSAAQATDGSDYNLSWWTADGGGGATLSDDEGYSLGGTIGQPDAGVWQGDGYTLAGGFWAAGVTGGPSAVYLPVVLRNHQSWDTYYEENDDHLAAYGPLVSDQPYQAYPDDIEDYYYFELSSGATVVVNVTDYAPTSSDGTVMLYGPAVGDDRGAFIDYYGELGHTSMTLDPWVLGPGKYYVRVRTATGHSTTQLYTLTVTVTSY